MSTRRQVLVGATALAVAWACPPVIAQSGYQQPLNGPKAFYDWRDAILQGDRTIYVRRGVGAVEAVTYVNADGTINEAGYIRMCWLMRDVRANKAVTMDVELMNMLCGMQRWALANGIHSIITLTSGFRTDQTNGATEGAAKESLHKRGMAVDFRMESIKSGQLGAMVSTFNERGGTGIYLAKNFVHADTGRARTWRG